MEERDICGKSMRNGIVGDREYLLALCSLRTPIPSYHFCYIGERKGGEQMGDADPVCDEISLRLETGRP